LGGRKGPQQPNKSRKEKRKETSEGGSAEPGKKPGGASKGLVQGSMVGKKKETSLLWARKTTNIGKKKKGREARLEKGKVRPESHAAWLTEGGERLPPLEGDKAAT